MTHPAPPDPATARRIASALTVPAPDPQQQPAAQTQPTQVHAWVEQLPFANLTRVATLLHDPLSQLNRHPHPLPQRPELMHCYQAAFERLFDALRREMQKKDGWGRQRQLSDLIGRTLKICVELAYGHKHIIRDTLGDCADSPPLGPLQRSIYFALKALGLELMLQYAEFTPGSRRAWREICQLYALAEQWNLLYQPVEVEGTIDLLFKRTALIALLDPYHLQRNEIWACFDYLSHWGAITKLLRPARVSRVNGLFAIDLQGMQQTAPYDPDKISLCTHHRLLNVIPLNQQVHHHLNQAEAADAPPIEGIADLPATEAIQMFRHMLLAWHVLPHRRSPREERYSRHNAVCGLSAVEHVLRAGGFVAEERGAGPADALALEQVAGIDAGESITLDGATLPTAHRAHHPVYNWRLFNRSAGGAGIIVTAPFPEALQVGQLVLLEMAPESEQDTPWTLGVVRRMIHRESETLEIGVQFIQGRPLPAALRPEVFGREEAAAFQPALALDRGRPGGGVLLASHGMYRPRRGFVLELEQRVMRIFADKLVESTPIFDRFEYGEMVSPRSLSLADRK